MQQAEAPVTDEEMTSAFSGSEPIVVKQQGKVVGYYIPMLPTNTAEAQSAMERWRAAVKVALAQSGMTEDEFADALIIGEGHDIAPRS